MLDELVCPGTAAGGRARVQQDRRARPGAEQHGESRPGRPRHRPKSERGGGHERFGRTGGDDRVRHTISDQPGRDTDRGIPPRADLTGRVLARTDQMGRFGQP